MQDPLEERVKSAESHAEVSIKNTEEIQKFGKKIQHFWKGAGAQGEVVEQAGKLGQQHAQASLYHAKKAMYPDTDSREEFIMASQEHSKEAQEQVKAVEEYGKVIQEQIIHSHQLLDETGN